jgi:hypothetical protein
MTESAERIPRRPTADGALSRLHQPHRRILAKQVEQRPQCPAARAVEARVALQNEAGVVAGSLDEIEMRLGARNGKGWHTALPGAQHLAPAPEPEILLGDTESVLRLAQDGKARLCRLPSGGR